MNTFTVRNGQLLESEVPAVVLSHLASRRCEECGTVLADSVHNDWCDACDARYQAAFAAGLVR